MFSSLKRALKSQSCCPKMEPQTIKMGFANSTSYFYQGSQEFLTASQDLHLSALKPYDGTHRAARGQDILLWRHSKPIWECSCVTCLRWPCLGREVVLGDLQRSFLTLMIPCLVSWFIQQHWDLQLYASLSSLCI